ncbi:MBL fold metallo-hydrolase [Roseibium sp.]|uniref:MBL fold metallo-hydrolase n=1 Tax=Roseibium sp. TaxID=1936156 RepID=UPI003A9744FC
MREHKSLFADWDEAAVDPIRDWFVGDYYSPQDDSFTTSIHSWLVKSPDLTILIDTGSGNGKPRPLSPRFGDLDTPFMDRLKAKGVSPEDVDYVLLTHLHIDHVGWNTVKRNGEWVPTFPNATYVMTKTERDAKDPLIGAREKPEGATFPFLDSVKPVLENASVKLVEGNEQGFLPGVDFIQTPGHAAGQMAIRLSDGDEQAVFIADVMHQPIQVYNPDWSSKYCEDGALARETRKKILAYAAETGCLILPAHFGGTHCGYVEKNEKGYSFRPSEVMP